VDWLVEANVLKKYAVSIFSPEDHHHSEKQATNCLSYGMVFDLGEISLQLYILGVKQGLSALPEEDRLKISENILLRGIFRPKRQAVTKGCKNT
jgi:hypothetical protein